MRRTLFLLFLALILVPAPAFGQGGDMKLLQMQQAAELGDADAMVQVGEAYRLGDGVPVNTAKAMEWYEKAAAKDNIGGLYLAAFFLNQARQPDSIGRAEAHMRRALDLCKSRPQDYYCLSPHLWLQLSFAQSGLSRLDDALASAEEARRIAESAATKDPWSLSAVYRAIGDTYTSIGDYDSAIANFETAKTHLLSLDPRQPLEEAALLVSIAIAHQRKGDHQQAIATDAETEKLVLEAGGKDHPYLGVIYNNWGWALRGLGRLDEAYAKFDQALPLLAKGYGPQSGEVSYALTNMGIIREQQGRHDEAMKLNFRGLVIQSRLRSAMLEPIRWTYQSLSHSFKAKGDIANAILFAKLAVNTHQQIRSLNTGLDSDKAKTLAKEWPDTYYELAGLLVNQGRIAEAQYVLDLLKQQELIEFVRGDEDAADATGTASLTAREKQKSEGLEAAMKGPMALAAELEALAQKQQQGAITPDEQQRMEALSSELDKSYEAFITSVDGVLKASGAEAAGVQDEVAALNLDYAADRQEMLRGFDKPTVLLQAVALNDSLNLFLTTRDISVHRQVKVSRADLAQQVLATLDAIEARAPEADTRLAELYQLLIQPVAADLDQSGAEVIMLNLGGFLRYLPFAALKSDQGYLIERYALVLDTPAAQTKFKATDRIKASAAGFGVTEAHAGFAPLPGVAKELEAIFQGQDKQGELAGAPLLDAAFTEDSLRDALQKRPTLLHVASHFKFVPGNETDTFLLLGNGDPLSLAQIRKNRGFRFGGVDLLTLSACETAKGGDGDGGELESFGAIAQKNGASAVMATLWPISDDPSAKLMADFYAGLVNDGLDKASALRRAQIAMLRGLDVKAVNLAERGASAPADDAAPAEVTTRHPYYWSPYILMGNWL